MTTTDRHARLVAGAIEPFVGQVYFSPECHDAYEKLGFGPSSANFGGVAMPDGPAYFTSRGSVMGQVAGEVVAAAFGVFNPAVVAPAVSYGWTLTDADAICAARTEGAVGQLRRILGDEPDGLDRLLPLLTRATADLAPAGRPLYAGVLNRGLPGEPLADAWHLGDRLREYRGDSHVNAWTSAGFDAVEIGLLTELFWGLPLRTYIRSRAWSNDDLDAAEERLVARGLVADGAFTDEGRAARSSVEDETDRQCAPIVDALGDDLDDFLEITGTWSRAVQDGHGYLATGPHQLAEAAIS